MRDKADSQYERGEKKGVKEAEAKRRVRQPSPSACNGRKANVASAGARLAKLNLCLSDQKVYRYPHQLSQVLTTRHLHRQAYRLQYRHSTIGVRQCLTHGLVASVHLAAVEPPEGVGCIVWGSGL